MTDKEILESKLIHFLNRRGIRRMIEKNTPSGIRLEQPKDRYKFYDRKKNA